MEREVAWKKYDEASLDELEALAVDYIDFISENKTERECAAAAIAAAEDAGYDSLADCIAAGTPVGPGSKLWACAQGKAVILVHVGAAPISEGMNILGAHIDSPRLDIKQNPLYETNDFALLDTHYYGCLLYTSDVYKRQPHGIDGRARKPITRFRAFFSTC